MFHTFRAKTVKLMLVAELRLIDNAETIHTSKWLKAGNITCYKCIAVALNM